MNIVPNFCANCGNKLDNTNHFSGMCSEKCLAEINDRTVQMAKECPHYWLPRGADDKHTCLYCGSKSS